MTDDWWDRPPRELRVAYTTSDGTRYHISHAAPHTLVMKVTTPGGNTFETVQPREHWHAVWMALNHEFDTDE